MTQNPWYRSGLLAWAATEAERDEQIAKAREMQGQRIERVQYFNLDYSNMEHAEDPDVPRLISDKSEWSDPSWRYDQFDCFDFYLQMDTAKQRSFTIGWDPPSELAGPWLREGVTNGEPFGSVAVWDVTTSPRWASLIGSVVSTVECRYRTEPNLPGWHNELITLTFGKQEIFVFLGDVEHGSPTPSANNLMVMSAPTPLPDWITD